MFSKRHVGQCFQKFPWVLRRVHIKDMWCLVFCRQGTVVTAVWGTDVLWAASCSLGIYGLSKKNADPVSHSLHIDEFSIMPEALRVFTGKECVLVCSLLRAGAYWYPNVVNCFSGDSIQMKLKMRPLAVFMSQTKKIAGISNKTLCLGNALLEMN